MTSTVSKSYHEKLPPVTNSETGNRSPGPSYEVGGMKHRLPPPNALKPYVDTTSGIFETWPAHASAYGGESKSMALTKNGSLVLIDDEELGKPQLTPKPKFLQKLETYLKAELNALGETEVKASQLRLQIHSEVFEYLIEDFKTYRPLLSAIKNEYELMITHLMDQVKEIDPLRQMLVTLTEECDRRIMEVRNEDKEELFNAKEENNRLSQRIQDLNNEIYARESEIERLKNELSTQYEKYRDEADARKLLISDITDLRYQQEDLIEAKKALEVEKDPADDPVLLKLALKKAREDERVATTKMNEMIANYGDVVPRRDWEALTKKHEALAETSESLKKDYDNLREEHTALMEVNNETIKEKADLFTEVERLKNTATPRPDWDRVGEFVRGGYDRWERLAEGKSTDQLVSVLINEMAFGGQDDDRQDFEALGTDEEVPPYLRGTGKIRKRHLHRRDCILIIKDIWRQKIDQEIEIHPSNRTDMGDFLHTYLKDHFGVEKICLEWGYNLHDSCESFAHDKIIGNFWGVLNGDIDETVTFSDHSTISRFLAYVNKCDDEMTATGSNPAGIGTITKEVFRLALRQFFPHKSSDDIDKLMRTCDDFPVTSASSTSDVSGLPEATAASGADLVTSVASAAGGGGTSITPAGASSHTTPGSALPSNTPGPAAITASGPEGSNTLVVKENTAIPVESFENSIDYKRMFVEDDEGKGTSFLEELKTQLEDDRKRFAEAIMEQIPADADQVPLETLHDAMKEVDPENKGIEEYLSWVYDIDPEDFGEAEPLERSVIRSRLEHGNIKRVSPPASNLQHSVTPSVANS